MAPELWSDDTEYTNNVDCWALGVVTYLLFSRIRPFDGTNITEKALKKNRVPVEQSTLYNPKKPNENNL